MGRIDHSIMPANFPEDERKADAKKANQAIILFHNGRRSTNFLFVSYEEGAWVITIVRSENIGA